MADVHDCGSCNAGCTNRYTDERKDEEVGSAPYLILAGVVIVGVSLILRWLVL